MVILAKYDIKSGLICIKSHKLTQKGNIFQLGFPTHYISCQLLHFQKFWHFLFANYSIYTHYILSNNTFFFSLNSSSVKIPLSLKPASSSICVAIETETVVCNCTCDGDICSCINPCPCN